MDSMWVIEYCDDVGDWFIHKAFEAETEEWVRSMAEKLQRETVDHPRYPGRKYRAVEYVRAPTVAEKP